ncbi:MAG: deoxyribodipyrimidine photo-lyase [Tatlockia sp.]|jgi:deoxyribodipyrimidine photo-lyase
MNIALCWFRQDLRLSDNPAFIAACNQHEAVIPLYIFDETTSVLGSAQRWWLHQSLTSLASDLQETGLQLVLRKGNPLQILTELAAQCSIEAINWNRCYEPLAIARDKHIKASLLHEGIAVYSTNGSLLNEPWTIKNKSGGFFKVFTPFWKHCLQTIQLPPAVKPLHQPRAVPLSGDSLSDWNLLPENPNWAAQFGTFWEPGEAGAQKKLSSFIENTLNGYHLERDIPARDATSKLSPHLHFGEISPWTIWRAIELAQWDASCSLSSITRFLAELGWREFSYYLLYHFPGLPDTNFRKEFDAFPWLHDAIALSRWQKGMTGYPIVDAGMRELWATGTMHNRVRMIVASFLTKDLLIDWRCGAKWFLDTLVDADLANNSASWQWVAGSGADAAPYFRIFNPVLQSEKFDPNGDYIRRWVPELAKASNQTIHQPGHLDKGYPKPIILHADARKRALECYKAIRKPD